MVVFKLAARRAEFWRAYRCAHIRSLPIPKSDTSGKRKIPAAAGPPRERGVRLVEF